jgi:hypothetical protein
MASGGDGKPLLTLEPVLDAVREGLLEAGWELSGLQKTTSYEFEGRWAGDSSRSAYLFFHRPGVPDWISIDVFLDETPRGLKGNLALVVEGPPLGDIGNPAEVLSRLAEATRETLPRGYRTPMTLRYRLPGAGAPVSDAETEIRIKLHIPARALQAGSSAVAALTSETVRSFQLLLNGAALRELAHWDDPED